MDTVVLPETTELTVTESRGWSTWVTVLVTVLVSLITFTIILSNILNIIVWLSIKQVAPATRIFLVNLSVSDLLVGTVACAPAIYSVRTGVWPYGDVFCQLSGITHGTSVTISIWSISLVAIDRYIAVSWPLKYSTIITKKRCCVVLVFLWVFAMSTFATPVFMSEGLVYFQFDPQYGLCGLYWAYPIFCVITGVYIPCLCGSILLFTTISITRALKAMSEDAKLRSKDDKQRQAMNKRALNVIIVTSVTYFLCWGPYVTLVIVEALSESVKEWSPDWLSFVSIWAANTNSGVNVIIYSLTNTAFKSQLRTFLVKLFLKCGLDLNKVKPSNASEGNSDGSTENRTNVTAVSHK